MRKKGVVPSVGVSEQREMEHIVEPEKETLVKSKNLSNVGFAMTAGRHLLLLKRNRSLNLRLFEKWKKSS